MHVGNCSSTEKGRRGERRTRARGALGNKDAGVGVRARAPEKETGVRARAAAAPSSSWRPARTERGRGRSQRPQEGRRGCALGRTQRKGRGRRAGREGAELPGPAGARGSAALAVPVAAAVIWSPSVCGRRVMAAAAVGAVDEFSGWTTEEERLRRPQQPGASQASAPLPCPRPARPQAGPSAGVAA